MRRVPFLVVVSLLVPQGGEARAHNLSQGYSRWEVEGATVRATVFLIAADYQAIVGLDPDENGMISEAELRAGEPALGVYASQTLRVSTTGGGPERRCEPRFDGVDLAGTEGIPPHVPFRMAFACPSPPAELRLRMGLFAGAPVRHTHVAVMRMADGETQEVVFTPETREAVLRAAPRGLGETAVEFWRMGVEHILGGYDHLLFLLALLVAAARFRDLVVIVTSFTVAHSVTLCLAALGVASLSPRIVEPAIAASIVYVAVENAWMAWRHARPRLPRGVVAFVFGLVHGFGFASALAETRMPRGHLVAALGAFNVGVETGQLCACGAAALVLHRLRRGGKDRAITLGLSAVAAVLGACWFVLRLLG